MATAPLVGRLPFVPGESAGRLITDGALSGDRKLLAVRTYARAFVFDVRSTTEPPRSRLVSLPCRVGRLEENQGECIGWWWDQRRRT